MLELKLLIWRALGANEFIVVVILGGDDNILSKFDNNIFPAYVDVK